jgi:hypothetical protein
MIFGLSTFPSPLFTAEINFSHRIDRFSFSEEERGAMSLDGDLKETEEGASYFVHRCLPNLPSP